MLYEPSLGLRYPAGSIQAVEQAVAAGDMEAAIVAVLVGILELSEEEIDAMRSSATPTWATRLASAPTLPRECRVEEGWVYQPRQFDAITAPTLLLAGSDTPCGPEQGDRSGCRRDPRRADPSARRACPHGPQDRSRHGRRTHPAVHLLVSLTPGDYSLGRTGMKRQARTAGCTGRRRGGVPERHSPTNPTTITDRRAGDR